MAALTITTRPTRDPNVMKFVANRILNPGAAKAYYDAHAGRADPIAAEFFKIPGLIGLMIVNDFCAANKTDTADWDDLIPPIQAAIRAQWE